LIASLEDSTAVSECGFSLTVANTNISNEKTLSKRVEQLRFIKVIGSSIFEFVVKALLLKRFALRKVLIRVGVILQYCYQTIKVSKISTKLVVVLL